MKFLLSCLCLVAVLAVVLADADSGHYVPKAFFTLDSEGHKSDVHPINKHVTHYLRRLRRQTVSSSSSSTSVSADGGPVFFSSQTYNSHVPGENAGGFATRFGGDDSAATTGHVVQTTGVINPDGKVYYKTKEGHF